MHVCNVTGSEVHVISLLNLDILQLPMQQRKQKHYLFYFSIYLNHILQIYTHTVQFISTLAHLIHQCHKVSVKSFFILNLKKIFFHIFMHLHLLTLLPVMLLQVPHLKRRIRVKMHCKKWQLFLYLLHSPEHWCLY